MIKIPRRPTLKAIDLQPLKECSNVQSLIIGEHQLESLSLEPLESCGNLQTLQLWANGLSKISLGPLASTSLEELNLNNNKLENLDLTPLRHCESLKNLYIGANKLKRIDLSPLQSCSQLRSVYMSNNPFSLIDLSPLSSCSSLESIRMTVNEMNEIDLSPLENLENLVELYLGVERMTNPDLSPLGVLQSLEKVHIQAESSKVIDLSFTVLREHYKEFVFTYFLSKRTQGRIVFVTMFDVGTYNERSIYLSDLTPIWYEVPTMPTNLRFIRRLIPIVRQISDERWKKLHLVQCVFANLGVEWLGLLDKGSWNFLDWFVDCETVTPQEVVEYTIPLICEQIDRGGSTIGMKIDRMVEHRELVNRMDRILELRRREMDNLQINMRKDRVNLYPLWMTAYGFEILSSTQIGLSNQSRADIKMLTDVGIKVTPVEEHPPHIHNEEVSEAFRIYVSWLAEHNGPQYWKLRNM